MPIGGMHSPSSGGLFVILMRASYFALVGRLSNTPSLKAASIARACVHNTCRVAVEASTCRHVPIASAKRVVVWGPLLIVPAIAPSGVHRTRSIAVQAQTRCRTDQGVPGACGMPMPTLELASVAGKRVRLPRSVAVQAKLSRCVAPSRWCVCACFVRRAEGGHSHCHNEQ
jgi:hypothetical protein